MAGEDALVVQDERKAREVASKRQIKQRDLKLAKQQKAKAGKHVCQYGIWRCQRIERGYES